MSGTAVNGAVLYCKYLSERLAERGHRVTLMVRGDAPGQGMPDGSVAVVASEMNRSPFEIARMARWIRDNEIDVIHTHMTRAHGFGVLLKAITGVPVVATAHSCSFQLHWPWNDFVIANSDATREYHQRTNRVPADRIRTVYCYSDLERFFDGRHQRVAALRKHYRVAEDDFLVTVVGEVTGRKGHLSLFESLPRIISAVPGFRLWILGNANRGTKYVRQLRQIQRRHQIYGRVRWLGLRADVQRYFTASNLAVVPSLEEPLGLVAIESLATGTPVVAARTGGLPEIVRDRQFGRLVQAGDSEELADAIIEMAQHPEQSDAWGEAGREFVRKQFDPAMLTEQVEEILQQVVTRQRNVG